tara:strand:- start:37 stop:276 length:240 start_codon:yes stop_codon:yes gene_type:complete
MIDTDKYEGHTPAPWDKLSEYCPVGSIDKQLIADAPLLLAEVKRLRKVIKKIKDCASINAQHDDILEKQEWEYILEVIE